jgi:hypothetical protein
MFNTKSLPDFMKPFMLSDMPNGSSPRRINTQTQTPIQIQPQTQTQTQTQTQPSTTGTLTSSFTQWFQRGTNAMRFTPSISSFSSSILLSYALRIATYVFSIALIILIILVIVHFTYKPIFKLQPGAPGIISVPGTDDGKLFWNKTTVDTIKNTDLPIQSMSYGYSFILDILIQQPLLTRNWPRIIFCRGTIPIQAKYEFKSGFNATMHNMLQPYNIAVALLGNTNDLIISVLCSSTNNTETSENVLVSNIPIQEPFRLGVVLMQNALEVYINGRLTTTKTLKSPPREIYGDITTSIGTDLDKLAKLRNLKIWPRILIPSEINDATPNKSTRAEMGAEDMTPNSSCST